MPSVDDLKLLQAAHPELVIHPLRVKDKIPLMTGWQTLTKTPASIENDVKRGANIGLVCGKASNITAIDFDSLLFQDDVVKGITELPTLRSKRTEGRGHVYFKYNPNLQSSKHHDLGIEVMSDGNNIVIPPSIHPSGDVYKWNNINSPIIEMPKVIEGNLNELFKTETELKQMLSDMRACFRDVLKDKRDVHGADGRQFMLALCTDMKSKGATDNHILMLSKLLYGKDFDKERCLQEWRNIDAKKTWKCETLKAKLPSYVNCYDCKKREKRAEKADKEPEQAEPETPQHIIDKSNEILKTGKAIDYLIDTYHSMHVGDTVTGKMILAAIASQSVLNSSGLQPKLSAGSGKGKSHAAKTILHLVPAKHVLETSLSGKALYYKEGLQAGTIIYSDDTEPDDDLQATIKKSTTNFQSKTNREISVKDDGKWSTQLFSIPERIVWLLTSVNDTGSIEYLNRQFNLSVDESAEQDELVWKRMQEKAITGETEYPINDNVLVCREIINEIKKHLFIVTIPYATKIEWSDKENRRNGAQFFDIIKAFAVFDFMNRTRVNDNTIEASIDDFNNALSLYATRATNQKLKLNDNEQRCLKLMVVGRYYTMSELQALFGSTQGTTYTLMHGRKDRNGGGLLNKVPALITDKETEYIGDMEEGTKKSKPKTLYCLTNDFKNMSSFESVAFLKKE